MEKQRSSFKGAILCIFVLTLIISFTFDFKDTIKAAATQPALKKETTPLIIKDQSSW